MCSDVTVLSTQTNNDHYIYDGIQDFYDFNGDFFVQFTIQAVDKLTTKPISDIAKIGLDTQSKFYQSPRFLFVPVTKYFQLAIDTSLDICSKDYTKNFNFQQQMN